jgi:hypothetical protein
VIGALRDNEEFKYNLVTLEDNEVTPNENAGPRQWSSTFL